MNKIINLFFKEWFNLISEVVSDSDFKTNLDYLDAIVKNFAKKILKYNALQTNFMNNSEKEIIESLETMGIPEIQKKINNNDFANEGIPIIAMDFDKALRKLEDNKYSTLRDFLYKSFGNVEVTAKDLANVIVAKVINKGIRHVDKDRISQTQSGMFSRSGTGPEGQDADVAAKSDPPPSVIADRNAGNTLLDKIIEDSKVCFKALGEKTKREIEDFDYGSIFKNIKNSTKYMHFCYINYFANYIENMLQTNVGKHEFENIIKSSIDNSNIKTTDQLQINAKKETGGRHGVHVAGLTGIANALATKKINAVSVEGRKIKEIKIDHFKNYCKKQVLINRNLLKAIAVRCVLGLIANGCSLSPKTALCMLPTYMIDELNEKLKLNIENPCSASEEEETKNDKPCYRTLAITGSNDAEKNNSLMEKFFDKGFPSLDTHTKYGMIFDKWIFGTIMHSMSNKGKTNSCAKDVNGWMTAYTDRNYAIENTQESFWNSYINNILNEIQYDLS